MSISKSQLDALNSGVLETIGSLDTPDLAEGVGMEKILFNIAQILVKDLRESATKKGVVATKRLRSSIAPTPAHTSGNIVEVAIVMDKHWKRAEKGRPPGKSPMKKIGKSWIAFKEIRDWITAKGIKLDVKKGQTTIQARAELALLIARKIGAKGTIKRFQYKGSGFIKSVLTTANQKIIAEHLAEMQGEKIRLYFKVNKGE